MSEMISLVEVMTKRFRRLAAKAQAESRGATDP